MKIQERTAIGILVLFYAVGIIGMQTSYRNFFLQLTPYHLLLSFVVFALSAKKQRNLAIDMILIAGCAYLIEWIGVHKGWLFGNYGYGSNLGPKADGIPLVIALNWVMLVFGAASLVKRISLPQSIQIILGALLMTGLDFLMEPVAVKSGYWSWASGEIPWFNYSCWFVFSGLFQMWIYRRKSVQVNKVWSVLFILMAAFFAILN